MLRVGANLVTWLQAFAAALQFLTRFPVPMRSIVYTEDVFRRSVVFYPAAGLLIGLFVSGIGAVLCLVFPPLVSGALITALWVLLTGGLHLDGLMDTADGILSHRPREQMLAIMKDSRVGAMGVIVCVVYLLLKTVLIISLVEIGNPEWLVWGMLIPVWSRTFMVTAIACWPYARKEPGLGQLFRTVRKFHAVASGVMAALFSLVVVLFAAWQWGVEIGFIPVFLPIFSFGLGTAIAVVISRKLGGLTGDVYGALNECIELGLLLALTGYAGNFG